MEFAIDIIARKFNDCLETAHIADIKIYVNSYKGDEIADGLMGNDGDYDDNDFADPNGN